MGATFAGRPSPDSEGSRMANANAEQDEGASPPQSTEKFFTFFVEKEEFHSKESSLPFGEMMDIAGVPRRIGLVQVMDDGTEKPCPEDEIFTFAGPGRRFKKAPEFRRG